VDARQERFANPFSMDTACTNCGRCAGRERVVHGYGDVGAEFLVVGAEPTAGAERTGVPFTGDAAGERLQRALGELDFSRSPPDAAEPDLQNVFLTYLTRCVDDHSPAEAELAACEPFVTAEIRMINPEIIVPVSQETLEALAFEYTTREPSELDAEAAHATTIRGRGFELVPMLALDRQDDDDTAAFVDHLRENVLGRDYRQTKGRRSR